MIKIFFKHLIYETCINMLFDNISKNFVCIKNNGFLEAGKKYRKLFFYYKFGESEWIKYTLMNSTILYVFIVDNKYYYGLEFKAMHGISNIRPNEKWVFNVNTKLYTLYEIDSRFEFQHISLTEVIE